MIKFQLYLFLTILLLSGCASVPQEPDEEPIAIKLNGTVVEVQTFIEEAVFNASAKAELLNADNRSITFQEDCMDVLDSSVRCAILMMTIGNSGWDGPFLNTTFRTNEIRGIIRVTLSTKWCAINAAGKRNCGSAYNNKMKNEVLRAMKNKYEVNVRKLD